MDTRFEAARTERPEALARALPTASAPYLEGALLNPSLRPEHLILFLKSPAVRGPLIEKIARRPEWIKVYEVRAAIVLHPRSPRVLAMNLVSFLWWHDLARAADRAGLAPTVRRTAERLLAIRVQEMALGEKVSLARVCSRGVIPALRREDAMVVRALLRNPRLVEEDVVAIASGNGVSPAVLASLAEDERWAVRPAVQRAIVRNPATPKVAALRLVQRLSTATLRDVARSPRVPALVKVAAMRLLETRARRKRAREGADTA